MRKYTTGKSLHWMHWDRCIESLISKISCAFLSTAFAPLDSVTRSACKPGPYYEKLISVSMVINLFSVCFLYFCFYSSVRKIVFLLVRLITVLCMKGATVGRTSSTSDYCCTSSTSVCFHPHFSGWRTIPKPMSSVQFVQHHAGRKMFITVQVVPILVKELMPKAAPVSKYNCIVMRCLLLGNVSEGFRNF